jgi:hypothetical protein
MRKAIAMHKDLRGLGSFPVTDEFYQSCDVCLESYPKDDIVHCDCDQHICVFCWDEHTKDCKEQD